MDDDAEQSWIAGSRKGDHTAFESLVRAHQRMIQSLTFRMTGSMSDAEDLAQEIFVRAWQHLDSFQGESRFSTWLYRIAMNACLNWRRRENRRNEVHDTWASNTWNDGSHHPADASSGEHDHRVQAVLDRLPAKQRAAIILTVYEEMNHAEAARVLGCSEATISWRVFAARSKLKRWLKSEAGL